MGRRNVIYGGMLAAHFAYGPQRDHLDASGVLDIYRDLAESA